MPDRVGIFIDGPNLYGSARRLTGKGQLAIPELVLWVAQGRDIAEVCYWTGILDQSVNPAAYAGQRRLLALIEQQIPNARIGRATLKRRGREWVEKGVDVGVTLDLVIGAMEDRWDVGVAVSGDGDLARAGQTVRAAGKRFEVAYCDRSLSNLLAHEADGLRRMSPAQIQQFQRPGN